jgi:hypothetical protein
MDVCEREHPCIYRNGTHLIGCHLLTGRENWKKEEC